MTVSHMQLETGNLRNFGPYTIRALSGALTGTLAVGGPPLENDLFAVRNVSQGDTFGAQTRPLAISRIHTRFIATQITTPARLVLRWDKVVNFSATHTTNRTSVLARCRKTTGYPAIPVAEVSAVIATVTNMATATYSQYDIDEPFDVLMANAYTNEAADAAYSLIAESTWEASHDCLPLILEGNEGLVCGLHADVAGINETLALGLGGTARLFVAIDFVR